MYIYRHTLSICVKKRSIEDYEDESIQRSELYIAQSAGASLHRGKNSPPTSDLCPVSWGCIIHWLLFCIVVRPPPNECPVYDTKRSDGEAPVMLELWKRQSNSSLPSLPGPFWVGVVAPDRVRSKGEIELNSALMLNWIAWNRTVLTFKLLMLNWIVWNRTVFDIETVYLC